MRVCGGGALRGGGLRIVLRQYRCERRGERARRDIFFKFCSLGRKTSPPLLDEWAFSGGERGEILDERIERPDDAASFILLNLEDSFRFVL